jgi:hypothetical protein
MRRVPLVLLALLAAPAARAAEPPKVYVVLWFDTEDYILPASDDAALRVADFLTAEGVRATFKVVGEKARALERRGRKDVIAALKKHEIGYHSNFHSVQPTPAMYLNGLGWDEGVAEFVRREGPGRADVERILGQAPTCYGQPGSSWGPQSFGALRQWDMIYLDAGSHVRLDDRPHYYCGVLNLYKLEHTLRADINAKDKLGEAQDRFLAARKKLLAEGGGVVSIYYHPCEWVHKQFWDGVNFAKGANPPPEQWKRPPQKSAEETKLSYEIFFDYVRFMKRFDDVKFITASEAAKLYRDRARGRAFNRDELKKIAAGVGEEVSFQRVGDGALSPAEVFALLNAYLVGHSLPFKEDKNKVEAAVGLLGPTGSAPALAEPVTTPWDQFTRTVLDVRDSLAKHGRVPSAVWLGSVPVPPEAYLRALAVVTQDLLDGKKPPETVTLRPTRLATLKYVADDDPKLWGWVIFPPGFRAPELMALAKKQAWTIKPALLTRE